MRTTLFMSMVMAVVACLVISACMPLSQRASVKADLQASAIDENKGNLNDAEKKLKRATESAPSNDPAMRDGAKLSLVRFYLRHDRAAEANKLAEECLQSIRARAGDLAANTAYAHEILGDVFLAESNLGAAQEQYEQALKIYETQAKESLHVAQSLNNLAVVMRKQKRLTDARDFYLKILELIKKQVPVSKRSVADCLSDLGACSLEAKDFQAAYNYYSNAAALYKSVSGANSAIEERTWRKAAEAAKGFMTPDGVLAITALADAIEKTPKPICTTKALQLLDLQLPPIYEHQPRAVNGIVRNMGSKPTKLVSIYLTYCNEQGKKLSTVVYSIRTVKANETYNFHYFFVPQGATSFKINSLVVL